jgi:hypothetical protein
MALRCEINTPEVEIDVAHALTVAKPWHGALATVYEHGQWWGVCNACGAQWSANDGGWEDNEGFDFDEVTEGDGSCEEGAA